MIGKQPKPANVVSRTLRNARLYLTSTHTNHGMRWHADAAQAMRLEMPDALALCERASKEWGVSCAVLDAQGNLATRESVLTEEQRSAARTLLVERPEVYEGTRVCINRDDSTKWFKRVTKTMLKFGVPSTGVNEFCDIAGVPS